MPYDGGLSQALMQPVDVSAFQDAAAQRMGPHTFAQLQRHRNPGDIQARNREHEELLREFIGLTGPMGAYLAPQGALLYNAIKASPLNQMLPWYNPESTTPAAFDTDYLQAITRPSVDYFTAPWRALFGGGG